MEKDYLKEVKDYLIKNGNLNSMGFENCSKMYSMTTENIKDFFNKYDLKDKSVLTVAASGDQRLNAYLAGAKEVTCFDTNPLSKLQLELKDAAVNNLNYELFINFFGLYTRKYGKSAEALDKNTLEKLSNIANDAYDFFEFVKSHNINYYDIYHRFNNNLSILENMNTYLNPDDYFFLKEDIKNKKIDFIESDIKSLKEKLNGKKYDLICLSNISDYIHLMYKDRPLYHFRELIDSLTDNLNLYGTIEVGYIYSTYYKFDNVSDFYKNDIRHEYFPTDTFHTLTVDAFQENGEKDKIITYQKLK